MKFSLIAAVDKKNGLGKNNALVWKLPSDMKFFSDVTTQTARPGLRNAVIMGRNTWESLPPKHRPLKNRLNLILSRSTDLKLPAGTPAATSLNEALEKLENDKTIDQVFVIGGAMLYAGAIHHPDCEKIYLTRLEQEFDCDVFFPAIDETMFTVTDRSGMKHENGIDFEFITYQKKRPA